MNIDKIHLVTPCFRKNIDGDIERKVYFFGVNILDISSNVNTGEITSMIFNSKEVDFNDENIISKLNEHLDKYNSEIEGLDYTNIAYLHVFGFNTITRTTDTETEYYLTIGDNHYLVAFETASGNISKIIENEDQIAVDKKENIDSLNEKFDEVRYSNYMKNKEKDAQ